MAGLGVAGASAAGARDGDDGDDYEGDSPYALEDTMGLPPIFDCNA
jgi:hypothetical protein